MRITLTDEQKAHCRALGIEVVPDVLEVADHEWRRAIGLWKRVGSDIDHELKAVGHLAWTKCRAVVSESEAVIQQEVQKIEAVRISTKLIERLLGFIALLILLLLLVTAFCGKAQAQWSQIKTVTFQNSDNTVAGLAAGPFTIRPSSGTWSRSGTTWTLTVTAASGSVAWDSITNPLGGGLSLTQFANGNTFLAVKRKTDTTPTGAFFDFQNALGSSLCKLDITGAFVGCSFPYANLTSKPTLPVTITAVAGQSLLGYDSTTGAFTQGALTAAQVGAPPTSRTLTGGAGIAAIGDLSADRTIATDSTKQSFLASGALTCGASTNGKMQVHTTPLQYCDNAGTPVLRYAAYADSTGKASTAAAADTATTATSATSATSATTAAALAANGTNCSANQAAGGVDASGNAESCVVPTLASIVPNTVPSATQVLIGNAGGTAYAPVTLSGPVSVTSAGVTSVATLNQNTSGTAANLSGTPALPNGTTATTQAAADNSTKLATTAYADAVLKAQYKIWSCESGLGDGLNAVTAGTYLQSFCFNTTGVTVTLTAVKCYTDNAGSSTLNAAGNTLGALLTGAVTCSSTIASGTQSANVLLTSGDYVKFTWVADGSSKQSTWVVTGTY